MTVSEAFSLVSSAISRGRPANAYLIVGSVRSSASELATLILRQLFGDRDLSAHPDIHHVRPEKKSRIISVEAINDGLVEEISKSAFEGGWKAGVIYGADRLRTESANAFLKTLEEPPPKTIFLLLTENPEQLLPTIVSRCQRIDLSDPNLRYLDPEYRSRVIYILASNHLESGVAKEAAAIQLAAVLEELKKISARLVNEDLDRSQTAAGEEIDKDTFEALVSSRYREFRSKFAATVMSWCRDLMALRAAPPSRSSYDDSGPVTPLVNDARRTTLESRAARISLAQAFNNIRVVEEYVTSLERSMPDESALSLLLDRLNLGTEP